MSFLRFLQNKNYTPPRSWRRVIASLFLVFVFLAIFPLWSSFVLAKSVIQTPQGSCEVEYRAYELIAGAYNVPVKGVSELGERFKGYSLYEYFEPKNGKFSGRKFFSFDVDGGFRIGGNLVISGDRTYLINDKNYKMVFSKEQPMVDAAGNNLKAEYFYLEPNGYDLYTRFKASLSKTWSDLDEDKMGPSVYFSKASSRLELPKGFFFSNNIGSKIVRLKTVFKDNNDLADISPSGYIDGRNYKNFKNNSAFNYFLDSKDFGDSLVEPSSFAFQDGKFYVVDRGAKTIYRYDDQFSDATREVMGGDNWDWRPEAVAVEVDASLTGTDKHILYITDSKNNRVIRTKFINVKDASPGFDWNKEWAKRKETNSPEMDYYTRVFLTGEETMTKVNGLETPDDQVATTTEFTDSSFSGQKVMVTGIPNENNNNSAYSTFIKYDPVKRRFGFQSDNKLFGDYSYYFGVGDKTNRVVVKNNGSLDLSKDNFVVDFWVKMEKFNNDQSFNANNYPGKGKDGNGDYIHTFVSQDPVFTFSYVIDAANKKKLRVEILKEKDSKPTLYDFADADFDMSENIWYHLALSRDNKEIRVFVNGQKKVFSSVANSSAKDGAWKPFDGDFEGYNIRSEKSDLVLGTFVKRNFSHINGWIDNFRLMRGVSNISFNTTDPVPTYYFDHPTDIVLGENGYFFVVDKGNHKVVKMKKDFSSWRAYGSLGSGEGFDQCDINNLEYRKRDSAKPSLFLTATCSSDEDSKPVLAEIIFNSYADDKDFMPSLVDASGYRAAKLHLGGDGGLFYGNSRFWDKRRQNIYKSYFSDGVNGWSIWKGGFWLRSVTDTIQDITDAGLTLKHDVKTGNKDIAGSEQNVSFLTLVPPANNCDANENFPVAAFDIGYLMERSVYADKNIKVYFYVSPDSASKVKIGLSKKPGASTSSDFSNDNFTVVKEVEIKPENRTGAASANSVLASATFYLPKNVNSTFSDLSSYSGAGRTKDLYLTVQACGKISFNNIQVVVEPEVDLGAMAFGSNDGDKNKIYFSDTGNGLVFKSGETAVESTNLDNITKNHKEGKLSYYGSRRVADKDKDLYLVNPVDLLTIPGSLDTVYILDSVNQNDFSVNSRFATSFKNNKTEIVSNKLTKRMEIYGNYNEDGLQVYLGGGGFTVGRASAPQIKQHVTIESGGVKTEDERVWTGYHIGPAISKCGKRNNVNGETVPPLIKECLYTYGGSSGNLYMECMKSSGKTVYPTVERKESTARDEMNIIVSANGGCPGVPAPAVYTYGTAVCNEGPEAIYQSSLYLKADCNQDQKYPKKDSSDPKDVPEVPPSECIGQWGWHTKWPVCHYFEAVIPNELSFTCDESYPSPQCSTDCGSACGNWAIGECPDPISPPDPGDAPSADDGPLPPDAMDDWQDAKDAYDAGVQAADSWKNGGKQACIDAAKERCLKDICHQAANARQCCSSGRYSYSLVCKRKSSTDCFEGNAIRWRNDVRYISIPLCADGGGNCVSTDTMELKIFSGPLYSFASQNFPRLEKMEKLIKIIEDNNYLAPKIYSSECRVESPVGSGNYIRRCPECPGGSEVRGAEEAAYANSGTFRRACYFSLASSKMTLKEGGPSGVVYKEYSFEDLLLNSGISELNGWVSDSKNSDEAGVSNSYEYPSPGGAKIYDLEHYFRMAIRNKLKYVAGGVTIEDMRLSDKTKETW